MEDIILIGYGGHGKSVSDTIERTGAFRIVGYTDGEVRHSPYPYLGTDEVLTHYLSNGIKNLAICIGYLGKGNFREVLYKKYKQLGFSFPIIIDPSAIVAGTAQIGEGSFIGKGAVVNAEAKIGEMCIINTAAIIEHECEVGAFSHVAVGAVLCGQVVVEEAALIGANATVIQCRRIHERQIVPAGATIR